MGICEIRGTRSGGRSMGNSLRDELLKVGLISEEREGRPRRSARKKSSPRRKRKPPPAEAPVGPSTATTSRNVLRENQRRTARFVRDPTLGGSVTENAKKALRRKIEALVARERRNDDKADIPYHFTKGKRIKRIYVTEAQRRALTDGGLVIAALEGDHHLLTPAAAEQLVSLAPQTVLASGAEAAGEPEPGIDEHPVPDDITW